MPAGKTTELLIRLALEAGVPVRAERLIDDLWSDQPAGVARNTLQVKVSKLRRALGDPALITGGAAGYALHLDPAASTRWRCCGWPRRCPARVAGIMRSAMFRGECCPAPASAPGSCRTGPGWRSPAG